MRKVLPRRGVARRTKRNFLAVRFSHPAALLRRNWPPVFCAGKITQEAVFMSKSISKSSITLRKVTISAVFLALAVVLSILTSFDIPVLGESGIKVGFSGIFTAFPAILFGPVYGGAVSGLADLLRALIKPTGAFNPLFTITAFLGGFLRGLVWMFIKNKKTTAVKYAALAASVLVGVAGVANTLFLKADGITAAFFDNIAEPSAVDVSGYSFIGKLVLSRAMITKNPGGNLSSYITYVTTALILVAALLLLIFIVDWAIGKFSKSDVYRDVGFKITLAMIISGLIQTTINTYILQQMIYPSWQQLGFFIVWVPRAIEEVVIRVLQAWIVTILYDIYLKQVKPRTFLAEK